MSIFESEFEMKIPFHDLDPMDVVWHGNYIKYMEQARCDMFEKLQYTYYDMETDGYAYPIAKMKTKFIKPLHFNQKIVIKTTLEEFEPAIIVKYKIFDKATGDLVFEAETMQIGVEISTKESIYNAPERLLKKMETDNEN